MIRKALIFLLTVTLAQAASSITGKVGRVTDGNTITIVTASEESVRVRLYGIDAPELKQAFGERAKEELSSLVFGKTVTVVVKHTDPYGRTVGRVWVTDHGVDFDVNTEMVGRGLAWWYRAYAKNDRALAQAEADAKEAKRGLWADANPIPPWEFRRNEAQAKTVPGR